ncbi:MAG TPA: glycosyl hydrolase [bacterium]|nr:glycosyl hydrolase [bacterium]
MKTHFSAHIGYFMVAALLGLPVEAANSQSPEFSWPEITKECRPWTYWWWLGSAVNKAELTRHLEAYRKAGMGGVHIVPIYGAKGFESEYIPYLTPEWMAMLAHTVSEAERLDLGVDMTSGTGWPFGGPWVGPHDASARVLFEEYAADDPRLAEPLKSQEQPEAVLRAVMAFWTESGKPPRKRGITGAGVSHVEEITDRVDSSGKLVWKDPEASCRIYAVFQGWTKQQVKRAAPGAEGNVLDYYSKEKLQHYLARFDTAFQSYSGKPVRAFYNDSFEVYRANWTDNFLEEFSKRRGYDLKTELPALLGKDFPDRVARVRCDFRETLFNLLYEEFTQPWVEWCHQKGSLTRNQAHGSPGNILDLYAAADIPETEGFGREGVEILVAKFASSAAHLSGKQRTSSETCTWLDEHFQSSLARVKQAVDPYFLAGINHVFYHGMAYSPEKAVFPGWLYYASTDFEMTNTFSRDLPQLNAYIARCQSFLQAGKPDNDFLLYFPIYDLWSKDLGAIDYLQYCRVHNSKDWLWTNLEPTYKTAQWLTEKGFSFDYVSDRMMAESLHGSQDGIVNGDLNYRAIVVAACEYLPIPTLESLIRIAREGGTVIFMGNPPRDVPGLGNLDKRREELHSLLRAVSYKALPDTSIRKADIGTGCFLAGMDMSAFVGRFFSDSREPVTDLGLSFIRRAHEDFVDYFILNRSDRSFDGWLPIRTKAESVVLFDPLRDTNGVARVRRTQEGTTEVRFRMEPGDSLILRAVFGAVSGPAWPNKTLETPIPIAAGQWEVEFLDGGPQIPKPWTTSTLYSWTENGNPIARDFSGTARYRVTFTAPDLSADGWMLDLGEVHESARVVLNGEPLGTTWCKPFSLDIGAKLRPGKNILEIEVTNLMANRIAAMDRAKIPWRTYFFVNIDYKDFDASAWPPLPSGLIGPVTLIPYRLEK